jgi:uncharacterized protein YutE (UPF0331/DUF86 family)
MSPLPERLVELRRHLDHLREIRPRVDSPEVLRRDLSLHNDVLFSLMTVCQLVIDVAASLAARHGLRFENYAEAVRSLAALPEFPPALIRQLEPLPGFRNILIHEYVTLDYGRVIEALERLQPVEEFLERVQRLELGR